MRKTSDVPLPLLILVKRKRIAFGGYSTNVNNIPHTLCFRTAAIGSNPSLGLFIQSIPERELSPDLHLFLLPIRLRERVPTTPTHKTETFIQDIPELTVNLRSARHLFSLLITFRRPLPVWQLPFIDTDMAIPRLTWHQFARSNHHAPFIHHADISILCSVLRAR